MKALWFVLAIALVEGSILDARRGCIVKITSGQIPATYESGPLVVTNDNVFLARGGSPCQTRSDLWRFKKNLELLDTLPNSGECVKLTSGATTTKGDKLYFGANDGFVYKVDTRKWTVTDRVNVNLLDVTSSIVDEEDQVAYFADNLIVGDSSITKVDLVSFTVIGNLSVPNQHVGQIAPSHSPNQNEILFFPQNGILRVDKNTMKVIATENILHGFVYTRGPKNLAVVGVNRERVGVIDLTTFQYVKTDLDDITLDIGTPWIAHWFLDTNTLLVIYDLGGFTTFDYRYQYYDMSDYSLIDDGVLRGPAAGFIQKSNTGISDRVNSTVYLRFYGGDAIVAMDVNRCHPVTEVTATNNETPFTTQNVQMSEVERHYFLAIIIVGSIVGILLLIAIGVGILLLIQRVPISTTFSKLNTYEKE